MRLTAFSDIALRVLLLMAGQLAEPFQARG